VKRGTGRWSVAFERARARSKGEKREAGGSGLGATWRLGMGKKEGAQARWGTAQVAGIGPRPAGAGGGVATRQWRAVGCERRGRGG
jgi:hypothetical protein